METVLDALKAMKKATYREVAARLDIEPVEALNMLREQKEQGLCDFSDGAWSLGMAKTSKTLPAKAPAPQASPLKGDEPAVVDPDVICQLLRDNGAMNTAALAEAVNRNSRGMVSVLCALAGKGVVVKNGKGKGVTWSLPEAADPVKPKAGQPEKTTSEIIQDIPTFASRPDDLIIPSSRFISSEIRRTRTKLANLQKLQGAMRELRRHKNLLAGLHDE